MQQQSRVWNLDGLGMAEKCVLEYMVTSPTANRIGCYRLPMEYIVCDLGIKRKVLQNAMKALIEKGLILYDRSTSVVAIKDFDLYVRNDGVLMADHIIEILSSLPASRAAEALFSWLSARVFDESAINRIKNKTWAAELSELTMPSFIEEASIGDERKKEPSVNKSADISLFSEGSAGSEEQKDTKNEPAEESVAPSEEPAPAPVPEEPTPAENTPSSEENADESPDKDAEEKTAPKQKKEKAVDPVKAQHIEEFEALWKRYPRKSDKSAALDGYLSMIKNGEITFAVASKALDSYLYKVKQEKTEPQYIIGGRAFFGKNGKRILEYVEAEDDGAQELFKLETMPKFNMFWAIYPKKNGKEQAENNFLEIVKSGEYTADQLIEAGKNYASECRAKNTEERYIKRADSFTDPTTKPFRDYIGRDDLNAFLNVHSGELEEKSENGIEAMNEFLKNEDEPTSADMENNNGTEPVSGDTNAAEADYAPEIPSYNDDEGSLMDINDDSFDIDDDQGSFQSGDDDGFLEESLDESGFLPSEGYGFDGDDDGMIAD